tara:strand:- start:450 stop:1205 length:756 start_codon:yes stop_codon:yes gene_type:complete
MEKNSWLYFNTEADDDNVGASTNCCFPAKNLVGMTPTADGTLTLNFKSMKNVSSAATDTVALTLGSANTHLDVMKTITRAINNTRPTFDGFVTVADDLTTIVGGAAGTATTEYVTSGSQETGTISACGTIDIAVATNSSITATADGTGTGTVPGGGFYTTDSANADHIVILPAPVPGTVVYLNSIGETGQAYELRTSDPSTITLNNVGSSAEESVVAATDVLVVAICLSTTAWIVNVYDRLGNFDHVPVAD